MIGRRFTDFLGKLRASGRESDRARLAAILELNRALAGAGDLRSLLTLLLDEAVVLFGAERGFVVLVGADAGGWQVAAARSLDREPVRNAERKVSKSILTRCLEEGSGVYCEDAREGDFAAAQSVADLSLRSVLCMPLRAGDRVLGALYLDHRFRSGAFGEQDLPWLAAFADQAALALHLHQLIADNQGLLRAAAERNAHLQVQVEQAERELTQLRPAPTRAELRHPYPEIVGESASLLACLERLERVLDGDYPVLLVGESGTGKELFARAIHRHGRRPKGPFVAVNVAAIAPTLLESELFGHVRGAFTGADRARVGLLREASGGVLFLDEVTEIDPAVQVKLLRFLEDRSLRPVGGEAEVQVDLRVVAATNRNPHEAIAAGLLRQDLYYRLAVVTLHLPALRERRGDVAAVAAWALESAARARGGAPRRLTTACLAALERRHWPGNVRQLCNEIQRLDALASSADIGPELLEPEVGASLPRSLDLRALEQWAIAEALKAAGGNKVQAARLLGISRRTLYHKLRGAAGEAGAKE